MEWQIKDQEPSHPEEIQAHFLTEQAAPQAIGWAGQEDRDC